MENRNGVTRQEEKIVNKTHEEKLGKGKYLKKKSFQKLQCTIKLQFIELISIKKIIRIIKKKNFIRVELLYKKQINIF